VTGVDGQVVNKMKKNVMTPFKLENVLFEMFWRCAKRFGVVFALLWTFWIQEPLGWAMEENTPIQKGELGSLKGVQGTRYNLKQLKSIATEITQKGFVNRPLNGYPILHIILMERSDAREKKDSYLRLFERALELKGVDKSIYDKHGSTLLSESIKNDDQEILNLLLEKGADPCIVNKNGITSFEVALSRGSDASVDILRKVTPISPAMVKNFQQYFEGALEEWDVKTVNRFLDLKLVSPADFKKQYRLDPKCSEAVNSLFKAGFWIRTIGDYKKEKKILDLRYELDRHELEGMRHGEDFEKHKFYTPYSPATFVKMGVQISLFGDVGVMIKTRERTIPYWYDGHTEELTRDMSFTKGETGINNGQSEGQYWEVKESDIAAMVQHMRDQNLKTSLSCVIEDDKYGIFKDPQLQREPFFRWNEGLFRYKRRDIFAICTNDPKDIRKAIELRSVLDIGVPILYYQDGTLRFCSL